MKTGIIKFSEQLIADLKEKNAFEDTHDFHAMAKTISMIRNALNSLREFVLRNKFISDDEEIRFFKEFKPVLLSQYFYQNAKTELYLFDSSQNNQGRRENYNKVLNQLTDYSLLHKNFYQYYVSGCNSNDENYFLRSRTVNYEIEFDSNFSTRYDSILSKLLANEMLKDYVMSRAAEYENQKVKSLLKWTDSKVALVELIYALHASGTINNKSDIKQIVMAFQQLFDIDLGNYSRVFAEIRIRKNGQTAFLDRIRENLLNRIDQFNN